MCGWVVLEEQPIGTVEAPDKREAERVAARTYGVGHIVRVQSAASWACREEELAAVRSRRHLVED